MVNLFWSFVLISLPSCVEQFVCIIIVFGGKKLWRINKKVGGYRPERKQRKTFIHFNKLSTYQLHFKCKNSPLPPSIVTF